MQIGFNVFKLSRICMHVNSFTKYYPVRRAGFLSHAGFTCSCMQRKILESFPCKAACIVLKLASHASFWTRKICSCNKPAKENLTSKQEILAWFWQTKGGLDVMTCMR
jgi:hypothetical protein